jgi:hypothetical protein
MKKLFIALTLSLFIAPLFAQDAAPEKSAPVTNTFATATLVENQTVAVPYKGSLELQIQHRFSPIETIHNLYGIYGSANTRIGLNYGVGDRLMIGAGTTKDYSLQDLQWKYLILRQTEDNSMPFTLAYYGNITADLRAEENFGPADSFKEMHRLSYFTQLILARKFSEKISVQVAPSLAYFNSVQYIDETNGYKNLNFGLHAGARANLFGNHSVYFEYDQLLTKQDLVDQPKPNFAFGWEINTGTHAFQVFATRYSLLNNQYNLLYSTSDKFMFGFNITVRF